MLPRLYRKTGAFSPGNGYGFFNHCSKCEVSEERNGEYSLEMVLMPNDRLVDTVIPGMLVKAKPNHIDPPQLFSVNDIEISSNNITNIYATHIKGLFFNTIVTPFEITETNSVNLTGTIYEIVETILARVRTHRPYMDKEGIMHSGQTVEVIGFDNTQKTLSIDLNKPLTLDEVFFGEGGIISTFGGEFKYDNEKIYLYKNRGVQTYKTIRYGSGISNFAQTLSNTENYNNVIGYAIFSNQGDSSVMNNLVYYIDSDIINVPGETTPYLFQKLLPVDFSDKFNDKYDASTPSGRADIRGRLQILTQRYVNSNTSKLGQSKANIVITEQNELNKLQDVGLCDKVRIVHSAAGLTLESNKINKVVYDSLLERYIQHEIGERKLNLSDYIKKSSRR